MSGPPVRYCHCGTRLARDNHDTRCAPCLRKALEHSLRPPQVPPEFWDTDQMRDAFTSRNIGRVVRAYRHHPFHGVDPLPQQLVGGWLGVGQAQLSRIEHGPPIADLDRLTRWAETLRIPPRQLWFDLPGSRRHDGQPGCSPGGGDNGWHHGVHGHAEEGRSAGVGHDLDQVEGLVAMSARRALRFAATAEGSNVGPEMLEQLWDDVRRLARAYPQQPLPALVGDLVEAQDVAFRLLEGRQRPDQARDLYLLAGVTSGLLANASYCLGDTHAGLTQARTAYVCADNAGHNGLRAWVRRQQSQLAYWAGWPHEAVRYARLGAEAAAQATGTAAVGLPAMQARGLAVLGDGSGVRAATERADAARQRVSPDELDELGGALTFTRPNQLYYAADATTWLPGEQQRAEREAADALSAYEQAGQAERSYANEAVARADLALARAGLGELDGTRDALGPVLDLPPTHRLSGIIAATLRVHAVLRTPQYGSSPVAQQLREEIEAFGQVPAGTALPR
ncbi:MAG: helix-turn-helix domain-containing protein [Pseudonocardiaceae bacterium]